MSPNPGPTFDIAVAAPEIDDTKSKPVKDNIMDNKKNIKKYKKINVNTEDINASSIFLSLYLMMNTPRGYTIFFI